MRPGILLIGDYPPPAGGISVHVKRLHQFLRGRGAWVRVLNIGKGKTALNEVESIRSPVHLGRRIWHFSGGDPIVHLHTSGNNIRSWMMALGVGSAGISCGVRRILTVHSGLASKFVSEHPSCLLLIRAALAAFDVVIAVSQSVREALQTSGISANRIIELPAFVADKLVPAEPPERFNVVRKRFTTLIAAACHPSLVYGREVLLDAMTLLIARRPEIALVLFGPGTEEP